jgi:hypothetical protein
MTVSCLVRSTGTRRRQGEAVLSLLQPTAQRLHVLRSIDIMPHRKCPHHQTRISRPPSGLIVHGGPTPVDVGQDLWLVPPGCQRPVPAVAGGPDDHIAVAQGSRDLGQRGVGHVRGVGSEKRDRPILRHLLPDPVKPLPEVAGPLFHDLHVPQAQCRG